MDSGAIRAKFGQDYVANERTFVMGIDQRFTARIAERFRNRPGRTWRRPAYWIG